ncbi:zinc ribbon domain-containing protein [Sciscionella sediminilitoris]|uniref:zinc ribbon domain-containing protein n=1 Tax=Sciscionella sediminilitoris TaxID=1445613 RepID=UPI0004DF6A97|nr:zinc ribbon domain-containing protein [Sciscionella sp. SE31]
MMLIEYACTECATSQEVWVRHTAAAAAECVACGGHTKRRFGGKLLRAAKAPTEPAPAHGHCAGAPGDCVLEPTAARMLDARIRGDRRAIDRETAHQERAIGEGRLDPGRSPMLGQP